LGPAFPTQYLVLRRSTAFAQAIHQSKHLGLDFGRSGQRQGSRSATRTAQFLTSAEAPAAVLRTASAICFATRRFRAALLLKAPPPDRTSCSTQAFGL